MGCFYCRGFSSLETQLYAEKVKRKKKTQKKPEKKAIKSFKRRQQRVVSIWCLLFKFFKLRKAGDIFIRFWAKNKWMAIDLKKSYYVLLCAKVCIIFPLNMHYFTCEFFTELIWNVQALDLLQSEKLFYFIFFYFLFWENCRNQNSYHGLKREAGGEAGGLVRHACMYLSRAFFLKCKSCTFLGSSDFLFLFFFLFVSFYLQAFCSALLLYLADNWKEIQNLCDVHLRTTAQCWFNTLKTLIKENQWQRSPF